MAGPRPAAPAEAGFALVEILVAMLLLSLVGLTLARFQSFQLAGSATLAELAAARLEADNLAVELMVMPQVSGGTSTGTAGNGGRQYVWQAVAGPPPDERRMADMVRIDISIARALGEPVLAERTIIRPLLWPNDSPQARPR